MPFDCFTSHELIEWLRDVIEHWCLRSHIRLHALNRAFFISHVFRVRFFAACFSRHVFRARRKRVVRQWWQPNPEPYYYEKGFSCSADAFKQHNCADFIAHTNISAGKKQCTLLSMWICWYSSCSSSLVIRQYKHGRDTHKRNKLNCTKRKNSWEKCINFDMSSILFAIQWHNKSNECKARKSNRKRSLQMIYHENKVHIKLLKKRIKMANVIHVAAVCMTPQTNFHGLKLWHAQGAV